MQVERFHGASSHQGETMPSGQETWLFDLKRSKTDGDREVARIRLGQVRHIPLFLFLSHLIALSVLIGTLGAGISTSILMMIGSCLVADAALMTAMGLRKRLGIRVHVLQRVMAIYAMVVTALWGLIGHILQFIPELAHGQTSAFVFGIGAIALALAAASSPSLLIGVAAVSLFSSWLYGLTAPVAASVFTVSLLFALFVGRPVATCCARRGDGCSWKRTRARRCASSTNMRRVARVGSGKPTRQGSSLMFRTSWPRMSGAARSNWSGGGSPTSCAWMRGSAKMRRKSVRLVSTCRRVSPLPMWWCARLRTRTCTGRCRATRSTTWTIASSAIAGWAPT